MTISETLKRATKALDAWNTSKETNSDNERFITSLEAISDDEIIDRLKNIKVGSVVTDIKVNTQELIALHGKFQGLKLQTITPDDLDVHLNRVLQEIRKGVKLIQHNLINRFQQQPEGQNYEHTNLQISLRDLTDKGRETLQELKNYQEAHDTYLRNLSGLPDNNKDFREHRSRLRDLQSGVLTLPELTIEKEQERNAKASMEKRTLIRQKISSALKKLESEGLSIEEFVECHKWIELYELKAEFESKLRTYHVIRK